MEDEKVKQLDETLKKQGLAVSMYEAVEKAKSILNVNSDIKHEENETGKISGKEGSIPNADSDNILKNESPTLNELMEEVGVTEEQVEAQESKKIDHIEEDINDIREEIKHADSDEKVEHIKDEIADANEKASELEEIKTGEEYTQEKNNSSEALQEVPAEEQYKVNETANETTIEGNNAQESKEEKQEEEFKDEKKIDLNKVFNFGKR